MKYFHFSAVREINLPEQQQHLVDGIYYLDGGDITDENTYNGFREFLAQKHGGNALEWIILSLSPLNEGPYERACDALTAAMHRWGWQHCADEKDLIKQIDALNRELDEYHKTENLRWSADMRAIKQWQEKTGRDNVWPDRCNMVVGMLEDRDRLIRHAAITGLALRDEGAAPEDPNESWRALPEHLTAAIERAEAEASKGKY